MPAIDYFYNPKGDDPANKIVEELHPVDTAVSRMVYSLEGPFFSTSILVEGKEGGNAWETLQPNRDFMFSPLFTSASAAVAIEIFSYIVMIATKYDQVRLTYQALGRYEDTKLLGEIMSVNPDRSSLDELAALRGSTTNWSDIVRDVNVQDNSMLEILVDQLAALRAAIANPYTSTDNRNFVITQLEIKMAETADSVNNFLARSVTPTDATAANEIQIWQGLEDRESTHLIITYISFDDTIQETFGLNVIKVGNDLYHSTYGHVSNNALNNITVDLSVESDMITVKATGPKDGQFKVNSISQH